MLQRCSTGRFATSEAWIYRLREPPEHPQEGREVGRKVPAPSSVRLTRRGAQVASLRSPILRAGMEIVAQGPLRPQAPPEGLP